MKKIDKLAIETLRFLSIDQIQQANSGHPGLPLGAAPLMYTIWERFMHYNPANPQWFNRDRFILSPGHGSALYYSMLHLAGFKVSLNDLKKFRQWGSITPGHPECNVTPGVDCSTGPLGHGIAMAVGFALGEAMLAAKYNQKGFKVIDHYTYGITSDGDLMEGVASEAASLAGTLGLGKLIFLYDDNKITIEGSTDIAFRENVEARFLAYGWQVLRVADSEDVDGLEKAIKEAKKDTKHPSLIIVRTHIGFGSPRQDMASAHGEPLGAEGVAATKEKAGWDPAKKFFVPAAVAKHFASRLEGEKKQEAAWNELMKAYAKAYPALAKELKARIAGKVKVDLQALEAIFVGKEKSATRESSSDILQLLAEQVPALAGGSGDLGPSNKTIVKQKQFVSADDFDGSNIHFGIREHAMGCVVNGLALHGGFVPYGATFLVFCDFLRPTIRMAALMEKPSVFVFTHDSIVVGEDGPTHQPIEQIMSLRLIPNTKVFRPADALETAVVWKMAVESKKSPACLCLSRQKLPILHKYIDAINAGAEKGAYVLSPAAKRAKAVLIATGSEVHLALAAQEKLAGENIFVNVVSMPSWEVFEEQSAEYKASVLPAKLPKLAIEAGVPMGWSRYTASEAGVLGISGKFGASGPGETVYAKYGFTVENVVKLVKESV